MNSNNADNTCGSDDLFANSSAETVVENINFSLILKESNLLTTDVRIINNSTQNNFHDYVNINSILGNNSENISRAVESKVSTTDKPTENNSLLANCIVAEVSNLPLKLYCPFCCNRYASEITLKGHIKDEHGCVLKSVAVNTSEVFLHHLCRLCHARFYDKDLLITHVSLYHQNDIITMFQEKTSNTSLVCGFCAFKVKNENKVQLSKHIEENHFEEYMIFINQKCVEECRNEFNSEISNSSITVLNDLFMHMSTSENDDQEINRNAVKTDNAVGKVIEERCSRNNDKKKRGELPIRRQLRFDLPEENCTKSTDKENIISCSTNVKRVTKCVPKTNKDKTFSKWKSVFSLKGKKIGKRKSVSKIITSTPNVEIGVRKTNYNTHAVSKNSGRPDVEAMTWKREDKYFSHKSEDKAKKVREDNNLSGKKSVRKLVTSTPKAVSVGSGGRNTNSNKQPFNKNLEKPESEVITLKRKNKQFSQKSVVVETEDNEKTIIEDNVEVGDKEMVACSNVLEFVSGSTSAWTPPEQTFKQFKCAICLEAFVNNGDLISHARHHHAGPLRLLQPSFKCGQCEAKFYKNSFLVKHCKFHHTPRCLKNLSPN
ncbi:uncharacterized protein [Periplaneta americana]|uniref:uncharacterized protein n=1 Tax=Periplaneta americana TaxID=6978 RepID=UPI0037E7CC16